MSAMNNFLLIDDHEVIRLGVKYMLLETFRPCSVTEAWDQQSAVQKLREMRYQLIIMDVYMPDANPIALMKQIKLLQADTPVLIFSMGSEKTYAGKFRNAGASGFISKAASLFELTKAITLVLNGRKYNSRSEAVRFVDDALKNNHTNPFQKLSAREFEIALLLLSGESVTRIAGLLGIKTSTAGTHKKNILTKLGIGNLIELAAIAKIYHVQSA
jgi:DNA-binding NarL/FixJ family response regulator